MRANEDVKVFYAHAEAFAAAVESMAAHLRGEGRAAEAQEILHSGPRAVAEFTAVLSQRIDVPLATRQLATALHTKAQALNPGERDHPSTGRGRAGAGVEGWWTLPPKVDSAAKR